WKDESIARSIVVVAEPVSNTVLVSAEPAAHKKLMAVLAKLDVAPKQTVISATVLEVPAAFVADAGLHVGAKPGALSPREIHMLTSLLRQAKAREEIDVLSQPRIQVTDNQTGYVQVGQDFPVQQAGAGAVVKAGITLRVTPRFEPDSKSVLLRAEYQSVRVSGQVEVNGVPQPVLNEETAQMTARVAFGDTLVLVAAPHLTREHSLTGVVRYLCGEKRQTLILLTPRAVEPAQVQPAGWFTK
ncbi:MAG: hypothetical protein K2V38_06950, partial [Gemmataceae bacterium]|nr:hypothetical protein [Gemmataceae bacterium]